eukprot:963706-Rhodomonas_salina.5
MARVTVGGERPGPQHAASFCQGTLYLVSPACPSLVPYASCPRYSKDLAIAIEPRNGDEYPRFSRDSSKIVTDSAENRGRRVRQSLLQQRPRRELQGYLRSQIKNKQPRSWYKLYGDCI